ncbi:MAG: winged helix-turn-helix domain-containing protein [Terriglobales bacterium]
MLRWALTLFLLVAACLHFGGFELAGHSGELRRAGAALRIQEKPLKLLQYLLARPGELVTRTELQKALWPDATFLDFEDGLNTAVRKLRKALGDEAEHPRFVETVPRRGYRWVGGAAAEIEAEPSTDRLGTSAARPGGLSRVGER